VGVVITPLNAAEMVLAYHTADPQYAAALVMEAINAAGYVVLNRAQYISFLETCATLAINAEVSIPSVVWL
jgi:hypothetical protein